MKKIKLLSSLFAVALLPIVLSNCSGTDDPSPAPVLEFIGGGNYVSGDISPACCH